MSTFDRIEIDPEKLGGQPCIVGTRLTVKRVVQLLAVYPDREELRAEFPELGDEDIKQALLYAATSLPDAVIDRPIAS